MGTNLSGEELDHLSYGHPGRETVWIHDSV
jgi:hypothetical protein